MSYSWLDCGYVCRKIKFLGDKPSFTFDIETRHLIYNANEMVGFCMKCKAWPMTVSVCHIADLTQEKNWNFWKYIAFLLAGFLTNWPWVHVDAGEDVLHQACTHLGLSVNQKPCFIATYKAHSTKLVNTLRAHSTKLVNTCCHSRKNLRKHLWMNFNVA